MQRRSTGRTDYGWRAAAPTLVVAALTYAGWIAVTLYAQALGPGLALPLLALALTQHSSLQHEILHGRPFARQRLNVALVFPALGLLVPYGRFRDLHLAHHHDPALTDPYDDPESNFLDPEVWVRLGHWVQRLLRANNTLLGRMLLGPWIGMAYLWRRDLAALHRGAPGIARAYAWHAVAVLPVAVWLGWVATVPLWVYGGACWGALAILRIRTFLEHRAHERSGGRSVIIEDRGPLSILFLNNNFHAVHHAHPNLPWHRLPGEYARRRTAILRRNGNYRYRSYGEVFARHLLTPKDPVPHPLAPAARPPAAATCDPLRGLVLNA